MSGELIHVVRLLRLYKLRDVGQEEIQRAAAQRWAREQRSNPKAHSYGNTASFFIYAAKKWLRFYGCLKMLCAPQMRFAEHLSDFARSMAEEQGLSPQSVRSHRWKTSKFLAWFGERHRSRPLRSGDLVSRGSREGPLSPDWHHLGGFPEFRPSRSLGGCNPRPS
jgi:hypothetical protein